MSPRNGKMFGGGSASVTDSPVNLDVSLFLFLFVFLFFVVVFFC